METNKHYLRVGAFVLLTIAAIALFCLWLVGSKDKDLSMHYRIHFTESVSGLNVGAPVKYRGVQVGKVETMSIEPNDLRLIRVDVSVLKSAPIKTDTIATLKLQGITGVMYIELIGKNPQAKDLVSEDEKDNQTTAFIPEIPSQPSVLETLMDKISHMASQADKLFSDRNVSSLNDIVRNLDKASKNVSEATQTIKEDPSKLIFSSKKKEKTEPRD